MNQLISRSCPTPINPNLASVYDVLAEYFRMTFMSSESYNIQQYSHEWTPLFACVRIRDLVADGQRILTTAQVAVLSAEEFGWGSKL